MATLYRKVYPVAMPPGAEIITRRGRRLARWTDGRGKLKQAPLAPGGRKVLHEADCWYARYRDSKMQKAAMKVLRFLAAGDEPMHGKPEGWAVGIVHTLANCDRRACGVPGMLNAEVEEFFSVTMNTIRRRAARIERGRRSEPTAVGGPSPPACSK